ncbi:MAG: c-type cytochrome [Porticoccaceae bacterium]|nr:c-type cytochrome [Porticoccaceae bacterium]
MTKSKRPYLLLLALCALVLISACDSKSQSADATGQETAALSPALAQGEAIVKSTCLVCHSQGMNGAPIVGNAKMWKPRASQGLGTLVQHAIEGYGLMPAKGGNESLGEEDIRLAVGYMLSRLPEGN